MLKANPRCSFVVLMGLLVVEEATASSSSSSNPSNRPDVTAFTFRSQLDHSPERDSPSNANNSHKIKSESEESSRVPSSNLYDGGCVVSAEAIMCSGGDGYFGFYPDYEDDGVEDEGSDDDDDDDNDGHSSMLSNASLRRSKVSASGYHQRLPPQTQTRDTQESDHTVETSSTASTLSRLSMTFVLSRPPRRMFGLN